MVWNSTSPDGTKSVKANTTPMQQNTTYTETTLNVDHYWNIGIDEDGRHKQVQMPKTETGGTPTDITLGTSMDGGMYLKETSYGRVEGFYRNTNGIYQFIPSFLTGTIALSSSITTIVSVPDETYGQVFLFTSDGQNSGSMGFYKASSGVCHAYSSVTQTGGSNTSYTNVRLSNGTLSSALNLNARIVSGPTATYEYRIIYWAI